MSDHTPLCLRCGKPLQWCTCRLGAPDEADDRRCSEMVRTTGFTGILGALLNRFIEFPHHFHPTGEKYVRAGYKHEHYDGLNPPTGNLFYEGKVTWHEYKCADCGLLIWRRK